MLTSQQKNTCHSPLRTPKICLTAKEKPHSLFIALPRIVLSFHLYSGSQIVVLSEVAWHAWKCVAYFVTWSGCCMHFHIFGFYCIRNSSFWCSTNLRRWSVTTSAEVLLGRTTLPVKTLPCESACGNTFCCSLWTRQNNNMRPSNTQFDLN